MSEAIDPTLFRETLGHYPTGVAVVTAVAEDGNPAGMVVGTFSSVSLDPPLIAFFPATSSGCFAHVRTAAAFCINVLASDQEALCRRLATGGAGKFDGVRWRSGPLGSPMCSSSRSGDAVPASAPTTSCSRRRRVAFSGRQLPTPGL